MVAFPEEDKEEALLFKDFCEKTPLAKKRSNLNSLTAEDDGADAKGKTVKKKKK